MTAPRHINIRALGPVEFTPEGRPKCRWCKKAIERGTRRRRWCSEACLNEYLIRSSAGTARFHVHRRDKGVCAVCRVDTDRVKRILDVLYDRARGWWGHRWEGMNKALHERRYERFAGWVHQHVAATFSRTSHLWEADHVTPVAEGGGASGLDNLRTLCKRCHARETGALRKRLNAQKREHRQPSLPLRKGAA